MKRFFIALSVVALLVVALSSSAQADHPWYGSYAYGGSYASGGCASSPYYSAYRAQPSYVVRYHNLGPSCSSSYVPYSYHYRAPSHVQYYRHGSHPHHGGHSGISLHFGF